MNIWQLGNTSVRSAMRIRDGLIAYSQSEIQGNIRHSDGDARFRDLLGDCGVVTLREDATHSVGRKWRSAMAKLGFIYPEIKRNMGFVQSDLGPVDTITPAGRNLIKAETIPAMQECFLRAMATPMEVCSSGRSFSPLRWTLALLLELEKNHLSASLNFNEMALFVQTSIPDDGLTKTINEILNFRKQREKLKNKRKYDREAYTKIAIATEKKTGTLHDYADMNIRYLKATGIVHACGNGIALIPEKRELAIALSQDLSFNKPLLDLYKSLCNVCPLPTDNIQLARQMLNNSLNQVKDFNIPCSIETRNLNTSAEINQVRYKVEELIAEKKEEIYASNQGTQWKEIAAYMDLLASRKSRTSIGGTDILIPKSEAPIFLEWSLWRAFLAIDTLVNHPNSVRRFKVDQDFMPISAAPGNSPDLVAEFDDFVIVIEVTLSESSRQEAMEGEPVRRHVADLMRQYQKPVYGLFIANRIDSNTAETFRKGVWFTEDDTRMELQIVPLTLEQFSSFFKAIFSSGKVYPKIIIELIKRCNRFKKSCKAPLWKQHIETIISEFIANKKMLNL